MAELRDQVVLLEAACHRALREDTHDDALVRRALLTALTAYHPTPPADAPAVVKGLSNVSHTYADLLQESFASGSGTAVHRNLERLCGTLRELREALDGTSGG